MRNRPTREEVAQLPELILASLKRAPMRSAEALALELGFCANTIRARLSAMQDVDLVSCAVEQGACAFARVKLWKAGEAPDGSLPSRHGNGLELRQSVRKSYPAIGRRDELVAALFGPVMREAA